MKTPLIAGAAAVLGAGFTYWALMPSPGAPEEAAPRNVTATTTTGSAEARVAALMKEVEELKAKLSAAAPPAPPPAAGPTAEARAAAAADRAKREGEIRKTLSENYATRLNRLTEKLELTPEQLTGVITWHNGWIEKEVAAALKSPPDPADYHLQMAYRQDLSPEVQATLTPEQRAVWEKYDADKRADSVESITNGEMGFIADTLDLTREQKDQLFPHLSRLYMEDTYADFANVVDVPSLAAQKDADNDRRREFYSAIFTPEQMTKWESIAADYKKSMLAQFKPPAPPK